jgi:hypothetical protein
MEANGCKKPRAHVDVSEVMNDSMEDGKALSITGNQKSKREPSRNKAKETKILSKEKIEGSYSFLTSCAD